MALAFWNGGTPRVVRSNKRLQLSNGDIVLNAQPDPMVDLYNYVETGPAPSRFQHALTTAYENNGWTITATRTAAWSDVSLIRERRMADVRAEAGARILAVLPDWKQRNLTARGVELTAKGAANWSVDELAEWQAGQILWGWVKSVRAASDAFDLAISVTTDPETAVSMSPAWPADPIGEGQ